MDDEKEPDDEVTWRHHVAGTVGWLLVGEADSSENAPPPKHQIVQANLAIGSLLKDKDMLTADLEASRSATKAKDAEIAALRGELAQREAQITALSALLGKGLEICREGAGKDNSDGGIRN